MDLMPSPLYCRVQLRFSKVFSFLLPRPADRHHPLLESGFILSISNIYVMPGNLLEDAGGNDAKGIAQLCLKKVIVGMIDEGQQAQREIRKVVQGLH